jgi:hypothetical protein
VKPESADPYDLKLRLVTALGRNVTMSSYPRFRPSTSPLFDFIPYRTEVWNNRIQTGSCSNNGAEENKATKSSISFREANLHEGRPAVRSAQRVCQRALGLTEECVIHCRMESDENLVTRPDSHCHTADREIQLGWRVSYETLQFCAPCRKFLVSNYENKLWGRRFSSHGL